MRCGFKKDIFWYVTIKGEVISNDQKEEIMEDYLLRYGDTVTEVTDTLDKHLSGCYNCKKEAESYSGLIRGIYAAKKLIH